MKKVFLILVSALVLSVTVFAGNRTKPLMVDNASLLTFTEADELNGRFEELSAENGYEIAVLTVKSTGGKGITAFADDFYDDNGYGTGSDDSGIMLVIDMSDREYWITTSGDAYTYLSDNDISAIGKAFADRVSAGYYKAFTAFAAEAVNRIEYNREHYNDSDYHGYDDYHGDGYAERGFTETVKDHAAPTIIASAIIGIIVALIVTGSMKSKLRSVKPRTNAEDYVVGGSFGITASNDIYLYSSVTKAEIPRDNNRSSSGGFHGGGGGHISSSGHTHGGGGGHF